MEITKEIKALYKLAKLEQHAREFKIDKKQLSDDIVSEKNKIINKIKNDGLDKNIK